jgi:ubiquinol-cytochrome c reductase iron-sulfur subunit
MLAALARHDVRLADASSAVPHQPGYAANRSRAAREPFLVVIGFCTHLGCSPTEKLASGADSGLGEDWPGGFLCPCHGSLFDLAGRVFRNQPAPTNLEVPPYQWLSDTRVLIGDAERSRD